MKMQFLFLSLLIPLLCNAQTNDQAYYLNAQDRKDYVLSIDQKKISKPVNRIWNRERQVFFMAPLVLKNNSNDTLKFWSMTCSWEDIYKADNKNIVIFAEHGCDSNFPEVISVAPQKTRVINVPLLLIKNSAAFIYKFRLGMYLFKYQKNVGMSYFTNKIVNNKLPKNNLIWSNEVEVPIGN